MMSILVKEHVEKEAMYRISDDEFGQGFSSKSDNFRLLTSSDNNDCPARVCLTELSAAEPKHHGTEMLQLVMYASFRIYIISYKYCRESNPTRVSSH